MPTTYSDQFFVMDPGNPPASGTALSVQNLDFIDNDDDGFIGTATGDTLGGAQIMNVWVGDTITVVMGGATVTVTGVTFYVDDGAGGTYAVFTPTDGTVLSDATFQSSTFVNDSTQIGVGTLGPACFAEGTLILTPGGLRPVETLRAGDTVVTLDHGPQVLRWVGGREVDGTGRFRPVRFARGALGNNRPLLVSPQHRMLLSGWRAELIFGQSEVLVAAKHLVNGDTIHEQPMPRVRYYHLLFESHEIVLSEGVASESFHPGAQLLAGDRALRDELAALFPEIEIEDGVSWATARPVLKAHEARLLLA